MNQVGPSLGNVLAQSVPTAPTRQALSASVIPISMSGAMVFVEEVGITDYYGLSMTSGAVVDGTNVLATSRGGLSRWIKMNLPAPVDTIGVNLSDEGVPLAGNPKTVIDVVGAGAAAVSTGVGTAQLIVPGGVTVSDEGVPLAGNPKLAIDFVGAGVTATTTGAGTAQVTIPGASPSSVNLQGTFGARPPASVQGREYLTTDSPEMFFDTGAAWTPRLMEIPFTKPLPVADPSLSWVNQNGGGVPGGPAVAVDSGDTMLISCPNNQTGGNTRRLLVENTPGGAGANFTFEIGFRLAFWPEPIPIFGGVLYESGTQKLIEFDFYFNAGALHLQLSKLTDPNAAVGAPYTDKVIPAVAVGAGLNWLKMQRVGGNYLWSFSSDGLDYLPYDTRAVNNFFTTEADKVGYLIDCSVASPDTRFQSRARVFNRRASSP